MVEKCISLSNKDEKDKVVLANVHKVKGLQSRVVILTCSSSQTEHDPVEKVTIHTSYNKKQNFIIAINKPSGFNQHYVSTDEYDTEKETEGIALMCEEDRIAYVAATRAEEVLFISSNSFL